MLKTTPNQKTSPRVALITGAGGVLCSRMAVALATNGMSVALMGRRREPLDAVASEITCHGGKALVVPCDVLDRAGLEAARAEIERRLGPVSVLVNGAGGNNPNATAQKEWLESSASLATDPGGTFFDLTPEGIQNVFALNYMGTLLPTQVFAKPMAEAGRGVVINISSAASLRPLTKVGAYGGAKSAVNSLTQWLAVHLAKAGVRVNAIVPGFFITEQNRALLTTPDGGLSPRAQKIIAHTPMGRFGEPGDLIGVLLWLVSDEAAGFVTGAVIPVDGGFTAYSGV